MEKEISPILVVNNANLKPYIEIFQYHPENITQQPLGLLVGFFEIREYSEDSAYVVNFLNSVLKKEYYLNPKRPVQESFDSALHKVNLALSELVKHGNINWLGKLDSAICVLEKNNIHFTVTGNAKILLSRNISLTDITEGLAPELPEPHPLKTFINVSSGKLEKSDKLIITSDDLFNILSVADLEKNIERFDKDKFAQFLRTALTNELDLAGTIVVDIDEPRKIIPKREKPATHASRDLNVFSEKAFAKKNRKSSSSPMEESEDISIEEYLAEAEKEYTDKKTGHIYIQGDEGNEETSSPMHERTQMAKEMLYDLSYGAKEFFAKQSSSLWKKTKRISSRISEYDYAGKFDVLKEAVDKKKQEFDRSRREKKEALEEIYRESEDSFQAEQKISRTEITPKRKSAPKENPEEIASESSLFEKINLAKAEISRQEDNRNAFSFSELLPSFSKIKKLLPSMTLKQKLFIFSTLLLIVTVPLALSKINFEKEPATSIETLPMTQISDNEKYSQEKNISFVEQIEKIREISGVIDAFPLEGSLYAVDERKITVLNGSEARDFSWPQEYGPGKLATYMSDLNLILVLTDKDKVISFSPVSLELKDNTITLPENSQIDFASTYLTYVYLLDSKNDQIYRYPRAEGGFGEKTDWLKEEIDLSSIKDMTIDDNVYLATGNGIKQLFRGKDTGFSLENSHTPINFENIVTDITMNGIYVLDIPNSRLIQFDKEGKLIKQYHHEAIANAEGFSVDEERRKAYLILPGEIDAMDL
ncbi:MAG: hypothetical protein UW95_C0001G0028 [Parcubacteria group bacterium GW2011_GWC1_45_14]|nr:MAG: hypothetical protein UW87_C0004G0006 [Candidatus Moranbacteria bacterium GW2011_GWC2_45_10]KKT95464.1 MAG: hypothetical protein UW95_C0001G0028 [Parcubacteria group bacterium GW2011_GWC1_45_14]